MTPPLGACLIRLPYPYLLVFSGPAVIEIDGYDDSKWRDISSNASRLYCNSCWKGRIHGYKVVDFIGRKLTLNCTSSQKKVPS